MTNDKKNKSKTSVKKNNDQLGENASEEYKSEEYSNATKGLQKNKN